MNTAGEAHKDTMDAIIQVFRTFIVVSRTQIEPEKVAAAKQAVTQAESIGSILDPTSYRKASASGTLERQLRLLKLYEHINHELAELFDDV